MIKGHFVGEEIGPAEEIEFEAVELVAGAEFLDEAKLVIADRLVENAEIKELAIGGVRF